MATAGVLTVVLTQSATSASFTARTDDLANKVTSATSFCPSAGSGFSVTGEDTATNGTGTNINTIYEPSASLAVGTSSGGDGYGFIRFDLPTTKPARCTITSATLRLYASTSQAATMSVHLAATPWTAVGLKWTNQPGYLATPVTSVAVPGSVGYQYFTVTDQVTAMFASPNNGFVVKDLLNAAAGGPTRYQIYDSFTGTNKPRLDVTWG
jgi:hypothetical protein